MPNTISELAGHIRQAPKVSFIIGAGASLRAGVPLAGGLVQRVREEFGHCLNGLPERDRSDYGKVMSRLSPADRKELIEPLLERSVISWGQIALARMMQEGYVERVLTFNFDLVLERASSLLGLHLPVYDFGVAPTREIQRLSQKAIIHLHGQSYGLTLLNTESETAKHKELIEPLLSDTLRNHVTIIAGYSGEADAAYEVIRDQYNSFTRLIWLGFSDEPATHLRPLLEKDYATYIGGQDFDLTMLALVQELGIWPPDLLSNPPQHLIETLGEVAEYPVPTGAVVDVLTRTRARLDDAASKWNQEDTAEDRAYAALASGSASANEVGLDVTGFQKLSPSARDAVAWTLVSRGNRLLETARSVSGLDARAMFLEAASKYEEALKINPLMHEAL
ncbi:MAG: hypothetical protein P1V35_09170, partial [Planctomycetota bacterium]|nr:hypothetical protein [Planctomycetota bacterium]